MDLSTYTEKLNSIRRKYQSMDDTELAQLANRHNIPHAYLNEYGDYMFLRQKITAKLTMLELESESESQSEAESE